MRRRRISKVKNKRAFRLKLKKHTVYSIAQILFFSASILIVLSFWRRGTILIQINEWLFALFSWTTLLLPFIFLSFGLLLTKLKTPLSQPNVVIGGILFFVSMATISQAGVMGQVFWVSFRDLLTPAGAYTVLVGLILIGFVIIFNTSLSHLGLFVVKVLTIIRSFIVGDTRLSKKDYVRNFEMVKKPVAKQRSFLGISFGRKDEAPKNVQVSLPARPAPNPIPKEMKVVPWTLPDPSILSSIEGGKTDTGDVGKNANIIEKTLESFGISAQIEEVNPGPAVTQYSLKVAIGTKLSKITALERDLALALAAPTGTIRIEAPIPGRDLVGIELPNKSLETVSFKEMMMSPEMTSAKSKLTVALGLDVSGRAIVANLVKMPHILIAGQTGSGKSVCINTFLASLLFRTTPYEVKLILVDPKRVELTNFSGVPHLLAPVIVDSRQVIQILGYLKKEMDTRLKTFEQVGVRNLEAYNEMGGMQLIPHIVLVIDELAEIMLSTQISSVEVEESIMRIAQLSRATGIHMVLATQRPSVDVITGLIKANIPCRIAFAVASQIDSRVILDSPGAEKLLGRGDMLFLPPDQAKPLRIQGAFVPDGDIKKIIEYVKSQGVEAVNDPSVFVDTTPAGLGEGSHGGGGGPLLEQAIRVSAGYERMSISLLQRKMHLGYNKAADMIEQLELVGALALSDGNSKGRQVLIGGDPDSFITTLSK
ncbi:hypothetical protein A2188_00785 [Candidatus Woesebacteria bacterium RIFOXYA1_FULL_43_9]|uniref:FtsK domain-containing protein n=1 Tax=Candidatus Woesebacteria bacterium RIFOXYA1_FULL_43_9 TaxID=1802534 RepID=A0A1F8CLB0_9BACT|nr:MAG: hypothetical protein A2188_00785 [Candidatus Woesebacteria bacterium RIFOXYA1_FULL_43_9]